METLQTLTTLVTIVSIVFGILNLILFFKIWGMTDNVKEILNVIKHDKNIHNDVVSLPNEKEESLWILEQIHIIDNEYQPMSERKLAIIRLEMKYPDAFKEYRCKYEYNPEKGIFENINYIKCKIDSIRRYN